jgi:methionyl-tRNA synthetase
VFIRKIDPTQFAREYNILTQRLYPWKDVVTPPFGSMLSEIEPGMTSKAHNHHEGETFIILEGRGLMKVNEQTAEVEAGAVIYLPPFSKHSLTNLSTEKNLQFLSIWWEDMELLKEQQASGDKQAATGKKVLIASTPPTPNGDLHLGHMSGPFTGADIYKRYLKLRGTQAYHFSGADDNQSYVALKADKIGMTPQETADHFGQMVYETLQKANVDLDLYYFPKKSPYHTAVVQEFFKKLYEDGKLIEKEVSVFCCETCDKYLSEAFVSGKCPHCGAGSDGNACEQCGQPNMCVDLVDPTCKHCGETPVVRQTKQLFFPLSQYEDELRAYYDKVKMGAHLTSLCENMLAEGMPDIPVSLVTDWGIPVPVEGYEHQRLYVWGEMGPAYLAATQELNDIIGQPQDWKNFWYDAEAERVEFFGFDNGYFYAVLIPALFMAYDKNIQLPTVFVTNEFLRLEGLKFSTSRGHAIWARELLEIVPADIVRFYLSYRRPETEQTNFVLKEFVSTVETELVQVWNQWLKDLGTKVANEYGGTVPDTGAYSPEHRRFYNKLNKLIEEAAVGYEAESFSPQQATRVLMELVRTANRFGKAEDCLRGVEARKDERRTGIALEVAAAKALAILAAPIMPEFAQRLWNNLGFTKELQWEETLTFVPGGQAISGLEIPYFQSVEHCLSQETPEEVVTA